VALSVVVAAQLSGVELAPLLDADGARNAGALLRGFAHPELGGEFLARIARLSLESLLIGVLATALAVAVGVVAAALCARVPGLEDAPDRALLPRALAHAIRFAVRGALAFFRSVPDVVWALLFVRMIGLGPGPAVLAIALTTGAIFGKLFAELAEAVEPESIRALRRIGVGRLGILVHAVLPQIWQQWTGFAFYHLECSVRSASILGIVGAGGLGTEIALDMRYFEYDKLATALLAVIAFVVAIEVASWLLRRRPFRVTLWLGGLGAVAAAVRLDIPWSQLTAQLVPSWLTGGAAPGAGFVGEAVRLAAQTVAMAWCATWGAAAVALALSPAAATTLSLSGYRPEAVVGRRGPGRASRWAAFLLVRMLLQACRAMPELTLALVFVVWVGPGPFAGVLAIGVHTAGVLGKLYTDVYEEVDPRSVAALEGAGASRLATWLYGVLPQATPRLLAVTLYRFEVNVRMTAMVGFVGAGGIGDSIDTAISLFHGAELVALLGVLFGAVVAIDLVGDRVRRRILRV
jgi:phosphonate transport system permease protein